jgi:uncharacterized protein YuzE
MRLTHDKETDSFYLKLRNLDISKTKPVCFLGRRLLIDVSQQGKVTGIEYLYTSLFKSVSIKLRGAYRTARASFLSLFTI